jgi:hypothetical protein
MGKVITPPHWTTRPARRPVPRDGWEPAPTQIIEPTYQRTGWAPPGTIAFEATIEYLNSTYHDLLPHVIRGTIPVLAEQDGTFFLDRPFVERIKDLIDRQLALVESQ